MVKAICAGLVVAPFAWALNTQLGLMLPPLTCRNGQDVSAMVAFALLALTIVCAAVSWRAEPAADAHTHTRNFVGRLGTLMAALFAYALVLQGLSTVMLSGCEH